MNFGPGKLHCLVVSAIWSHVTADVQNILPPGASGPGRGPSQEEGRGNYFPYLALFTTSSAKQILTHYLWCANKLPTSGALAPSVMSASDRFVTASFESPEELSAGFLAAAQDGILIIKVYRIGVRGGKYGL